jgi:hypothetical protein
VTTVGLQLAAPDEPPTSWPAPIAQALAKLRRYLPD